MLKNDRRHIVPPLGARTRVTSRDPMDVYGVGRVLAGDAVGTIAEVIPREPMYMVNFERDGKVWTRALYHSDLNVQPSR